MKRIILVLVVVFFVISCKEGRQNNAFIQEKIDSVNRNESKSLQTVTDTKKFCIEDFYGIFNEALIGMEKTGLETKKISVKNFQVDTEAVCYGRTLLKMNISKTKVSICSYYNTNTYREYEILECDVLDETLVIKTNSEEISLLIIEKLKDIPIFSLKFKGNIMEVEPYVEIMIGDYIAKESDIEKFGGIPDCGDFDG